MRNIHFLLSSIVAALVQVGLAVRGHISEEAATNDDFLIKVLGMFVVAVIAALVARAAGVGSGDKEHCMFQGAVMSAGGTVTGGIVSFVGYLIVARDRLYGPSDYTFPIAEMIGIALMAGVIIIPAYLTAYAVHVLVLRSEEEDAG